MKKKQDIPRSSTRTHKLTKEKKHAYKTKQTVMSNSNVPIQGISSIPLLPPVTSSNKKQLSTNKQKQKTKQAHKPTNKHEKYH